MTVNDMKGEPCRARNGFWISFKCCGAIVGHLNETALATGQLQMEFARGAEIEHLADRSGQCQSLGRPVARKPSIFTVSACKNPAPGGGGR